MQATPLWILVIIPCDISQQLEGRKGRKEEEVLQVSKREEGFVGWVGGGGGKGGGKGGQGKGGGCFSGGEGGRGGGGGGGGGGGEKDWERWSRKKCRVVVQESKTGQRQVAQLHQSSLPRKRVPQKDRHRTHSRLPMLSRSPVPGKKLSPYLWKDTVITLLVVRNASSTPSP